MTKPLVERMWDAYAQAHFKLTNTRPTELELAGMEAVLQTLLDADELVTLEYHRQAIMNVMQLDMLRRLHLERTDLKQAVRSLEDANEKLCAYVNEAAGPVNMLVPVAAMELVTRRIDRLVGALEKIAGPEGRPFLGYDGQLARKALNEQLT